MTEFGMVTQMGSSVFLGVCQSGWSKRGGASASAKFWGPIPTPKRFDLGRRAGLPVTSSYNHSIESIKKLRLKSEGLAYEKRRKSIPLAYHTPKTRPPGVRTPNSKSLTEALISSIRAACHNFTFHKQTFYFPFHNYPFTCTTSRLILQICKSRNFSQN